MSKKLHNLKPCAQLIALREAVQTNQQNQHRFVQIIKRFGLTLPQSKTEADHAILAAMGKGNAYWQKQM